VRFARRGVDAKAQDAVPEARGVAVTALILGQLVLVLAARSPDRPLWKTSVRGNRALWPVLGVTFLSLLVVLYVPPVAGALELAPLPFLDWLGAAFVAALTTLWMEPLKRQNQ